eukprot:929559_1
MATSRHKRKHECNVNVNVVVRCRPPSDYEVKNGKVQTVRCSSKEVIIEKFENRASRRNAVEKKFTFDRVYGQSATQEEVFTQTVVPMVDEVLQGFNCTIFAYGQTGTGKTYTMEGDIAFEGSDMSSQKAGVIPRAIELIFARLKQQKIESSVQISFLELYNEELRDLLADEHKQLRIFDDLAKSGVTVANLEEFVVRSPMDIAQLMQKGVAKRRTAQTKLNPNSSRSHCIFTMVIHMKETDKSGEEDIIKTGTLNLVDLAGSECVGRSGAVNKRAKEAGMINTSLLTLARVISALVDRLPYIPYRDSKITRLLQESLGGRAKTVIIATISPCASDETVSTLEYAHRAKRVMNKPEVNQKMTRRKYCQDMMAKIAELQKENECLRREHGIFLPETKYEQMVADLGERSKRIEEIQAQLDSHIMKFRQLQELFDRKSTDFERIRDEKKAVEDALSSVRSNLKATRKALSDTATQLEEHRFLVSEHSENERVLHGQASVLQSTLKESLSENHRLHDKIDRKLKVETTNLSSAQKFRIALGQRLDTIESRVTKFRKGEVVQCEQLGNTLRDFMSNKKKEVQQLESQLQSFCTDLSTRQDTLSSTFTKNSERARASVSSMSSAVASSRESMGSSSRSAREQSLAQISEIRKTLEKWSKEFADIGELVSSKLTTHSDEIKTFSESQTKCFTELRQTVNQSSDAQIDCLESSQRAVCSFMDHQRDRSATMLTELVDSIRSKVADFVTTQQSEWKAARGNLEGSMEAAVKKTRDSTTSIQSLLDNQQCSMARWESSQTEVIDGLKSSTNERCQAGQNALSDASSYVSTHHKDVDSAFKLLESESDKLCELVEKDANAELSSISASNDTVQTTIGELTSAREAFATEQVATLEAHAERLKRFTEGVRSDHVGARRERVEKNCAAFSSECADVNDMARRFLEKEIQIDVATGQTPIRRTVQYPTDLRRTDSQFALLQRFRNEKKSSRGDGTEMSDKEEALSESNSAPVISDPMSDEDPGGPPPPSSVPGIPPPQSEEGADKENCAAALRSSLTEPSSSLSERSSSDISPEGAGKQTLPKRSRKPAKRKVRANASGEGRSKKLKVRQTHSAAESRRGRGEGGRIRWG